MLNQIIHGDSSEVLKDFPNDYFDALISDAPAGIHFMNKDFDHNKGGMLNWVNWLSEIMAECLRVMKPGACGLVWSLPRTSHWTGMALELAGFRIIDICHVAQGQGFPKSQDISKQIDQLFGEERDVVGFKTRPDGTQRPNSVNWKENEYFVGLPKINLETAPASPEAKQWDGWKTPALKPSIEGWWIIEKPRLNTHFNLESKDVIIEWNTLIQYFVALCLSANSAKTVFSLPQKGFVTLDIGGQKLGSVLENVVNNPSVKSVTTPEKMDTFKSPEMGKIALSIVSLWNSILKEALTKESISTTSTGSNLTTELKISYLLTLESISQNTIHHSNKLNAGNSFLVQNVELFLKGRNQLLRKVITSSVVENVLTNIGIILLSSLAKIAESNSVEKDMIVNSVQSVVALNLIKKQDLDKKEKQLLVNSAKKPLNAGSQVIQNTVVESAWQTLLQVAGNKRLLPAVEDWWLVQKPISESSIARNILKHGVGGLNIEACRVGTWDNDVNKRENNGNHKHNKSVYCGNSLLTSKTEYKEFTYNSGRYPANLILSCGANCKGENHSPDCPVTVVGEQSGICTSGSGKKGSADTKYFSGKKALDTIWIGDTGTAARFFKQLPFDPETIPSVYYQAKASPSDRSSNGEIKNTHPTVKSRHLMKYLITLITPENGIVLDPFCGSGTTAVACKELGRNYICIEKEKEYFDIACDRISQPREYSELELEIAELKQPEFKQLSLLDLV